MSKKATYTAVKWLFVIAAFSYLAYKLISFDQYGEFVEQWRQAPPERFWWLAGVFVLFPANWGLEAVKWRFITAKVQKLSFGHALKGVLAGVTAGFFTPNRIGDLFGRIIFLRPENRASGVTLSLLNSLTQNLTIVLCGIPACVLLFSQSGRMNADVRIYLLLSAVLFAVLALCYFFLPALSRKSAGTRFWEKIGAFIGCLADYSPGSLLKIIIVSLVRFAVFSTQFFFMLRFFGVALTPWQALLTIPANYLFVTITPSLAFSEAAVRASYAMAIFGIFSDQTVSIALAGVAVWFVNWVVPLIAGSVVMLKEKTD